MLSPAPAPFYVVGGWNVSPLRLLGKYIILSWFNESHKIIDMDFLFETLVFW